MDEETPKYLRLFLFHMLSDVSSSQMVSSTHDLINNLLRSFTSVAGEAQVSYFDANILQLLLTSLLKPSLVPMFNQRETAKGSKKELAGGTKYFATFIQALSTPTSIAFSGNEHATTSRHTSLQLVDYFSPRLSVLKCLVEANGFHFMAGLSLDNKKALFMHFIEILLESSYTDPSSATEPETPKADDGKSRHDLLLPVKRPLPYLDVLVIIPETYPRHKEIDMSVVDSSKSIIKSIIRAMNLSSQLVLKCLQEQINIARNRAKALARKEKSTAQEDAGAGKKAKAPRATDEDDEESDEPVSAKRARVATKETDGGTGPLDINSKCVINHRLHGTFLSRQVSRC